MKKNCKSCILIIIILIIIIGAVCFKVGFYIGGAKYKKVIDYHFPMPETMINVSGQITEIQNNVLSVETKVQDSYAVPEEWKTRIVKVTIEDETKITKVNLQTDKTSEIELSEFKIGDQIVARANENIKDKTEFTAKSIELYIVPKTD